MSARTAAKEVFVSSRGSASVENEENTYRSRKADLENIKEQDDELADLNIYPEAAQGVQS